MTDQPKGAPPKPPGRITIREGGGEVRFSYNAQGEIMEFTAANAAAQVLKGDTIVLMRKLPKADGDA